MRNCIYITVLLCCIFILFSMGYANGPTVTAVPQGSIPAKADEYICISYFGSEGCHNCEDVATVVANGLFEEYPNLVLILYELENHPDNAGVIGDYNSKYKAGFMVPIVILNKEVKGAGGKTLQHKIKEMVAGVKTNKCPLVDSEVAFEDLDINSIPGEPQIWLKDRILLKEDEGKVDNAVLKQLLTTDDIDAEVAKIAHNEAEPEHHEIVEKLFFKKAIQIGGWLFQWEPYFED